MLLAGVAGSGTVVVARRRRTQQAAMARAVGGAT
jgi:hypothetical protein